MIIEGNAILKDGQFVSGYVNGNGYISANGYGAHAEGYADIISIDASGNGAHAEGCGTHASAGGAHAEGIFTNASAGGAHAEGGFTVSSSVYSHAEGYFTYATGNSAHAEGMGTYATGKGAHAEGYTENYTYKSICASGNGAHAGGYIPSSRCDIHALGNGSFAHGYAYDEQAGDGKYSKIIAHDGGTIAMGCAQNGGIIIANNTGAVAMGYAIDTQDVSRLEANGNGAVAIGYGTQAIGEGAFACGYGTIANSSYMTAVGKFNKNEAVSDILFAVGNGNSDAKRSNAFWVKNDDTAHSQNGFYDESDIRKKDILSNISLEKSYELLDKCQEIIYTLKEDPNKKEQVGMIAQEVEEFFPEIVSTDSEGYKSLDYARLSVICLRLIKDIVEQIKEIKNEIKNING